LIIAVEKNTYLLDIQKLYNALFRENETLNKTSTEQMRRVSSLLMGLIRRIKHFALCLEKFFAFLQ